MIPVCEPTLAGKELEYVSDCIKTNWISSMGGYITRFEELFSNFCGVNHGVSCCNGTAALHLALASLGIGPGDEVILPTFTMVASANAVVYCGAKPVFIDSEPRTWNMDVSQIEERITKNTKAIMPVHIYGHPVDIDPLLKIAKKHDLFVVEDAAEAHGAEYKSKKAGSLGDVACFSFYANKILTTGEGGMVVTSNEEIAEKAKSLRNHAFGKPRFLHKEIGFNYRMTNIQAAIGCAQMEKIEQFIEARRQNAKLYSSLLKHEKGLTLPVEESWAKNVYWMYGLLIENGFGITKDKAMESLRNLDVDTRSFFYPLHSQPAYTKLLGKQEDCPVADALGRKGLYLPSASSLTEEQVHKVVEALLSLKK